MGTLKQKAEKVYKRYEEQKILKMTIELPSNLHRELKFYCLENECSLKDVISVLINECLNKQKKNSDIK